MEPVIPPWPGRILKIALQASQRWMWLGAGWAALCGAVASGELRPDGAALIRLLALLLLADGLLGAVWEALAAVSERVSAPGSRATGAQATIAVQDLGEAAEATAGAAFPLAVVTAPFPPRVGRWLADAGRKTADAWPALARWSVAVGMSLTIALLLGPLVATLVTLGLLFPLVVAFAVGGLPLRGGLTRAVVEVSLPWSLGVAAFSTLPDLGAAPADRVAAAVLWAAAHGTYFLVAGLFGVAYYALLTLDHPSRWRIALLNLIQGLGVVLLVLWQQPLPASAAAFVWLAQLPFQPYLRVGYVRWYLHHTQWFVMAWMLTVSLGVALR